MSFFVFRFEIRFRSKFTGTDSFYDAWLIINEKKRDCFDYDIFNKRFPQLGYGDDDSNPGQSSPVWSAKNRKRKVQIQSSSDSSETDEKSKSPCVCSSKRKKQMLPTVSNQPSKMMENTFNEGILNIELGETNDSGFSNEPDKEIKFWEVRRFVQKHIEPVIVSSDEEDIKPARLLTPTVPIVDTILISSDDENNEN